MPSREEIIKSLEGCMDVHRSGLWSSGCMSCAYEKQSNPKCFMDLTKDVIALLREQPEIVRCKDCKYWDKTTREEGNDCISGPWEDAVCEVFRDWDSYGDLGEHFRRTNGDWFCADGERR